MGAPAPLPHEIFRYTLRLTVVPRCIGPHFGTNLNTLNTCHAPIC
ncbi:hypothetical protein BN2475_40123 [Paraburkholderia ribeironis]|uniref:Uncharacterized protein n=1 Tax=Paraburkholderia ribeironis TaxID=1247936 RepID=A0A1N7RJQ8_9BURK|nr:hypothetical protein BN2475_40123 [Paraburkholderia ribeironis]